MPKVNKYCFSLTDVVRASGNNIRAVRKHIYVDGLDFSDLSVLARYVVGSRLRRSNKKQ